MVIGIIKRIAGILNGTDDVSRVLPVTPITVCEMDVVDGNTKKSIKSSPFFSWFVITTRLKK
jgi:hypothetical protein